MIAFCDVQVESHFDFVAQSPTTRGYVDVANLVDQVSFLILVKLLATDVGKKLKRVD